MPFPSLYNQLPFSADPTTTMDEFNNSDAFNYEPLTGDLSIPNAAVEEFQTPNLQDIPGFDPNKISSNSTPYLPNQNSSTNEPYYNPPPFRHSLLNTIEENVSKAVINPFPSEPAPSQYFFEEKLQELKNFNQSSNVSPVHHLQEFQSSPLPQSTPHPLPDLESFRVTQEPLEAQDFFEAPRGKASQAAQFGIGGLGLPSIPLENLIPQLQNHDTEIHPFFLTPTAPVTLTIPVTPTTPSSSLSNKLSAFSPITPSLNSLRGSGSRGHGRRSGRGRARKIDNIMVKELPDEWKNIWNYDYSHAVPNDVFDSLYTGFLVQAEEVATSDKLILRDSIKREAETKGLGTLSNSKVSRRREAKVSRKFEESFNEQVRIKLAYLLKNYAGLWYRVQQAERRLEMNGAGASGVGAAPTGNESVDGTCPVEDFQFRRGNVQGGVDRLV